VADDNIPDIFADAVTTSVSPYGVTLTFYLSDPLAPATGTPQVGRIVGRARIAPALAEALADSIKQGLANLPDRAVVKDADE
jgi:hypothetical protein